MIFTIIIFALVGAIVFFHYLQGFFSATMSAILAAVAAVLAFSYHETVVESVLRGKMPNVAHGLVLAAMFAVIYIILRVMFDSMVPGNVRVPAVVDRVGGALMGLVAALFATGVVAVAAQQLPFPASLGGYTRYETKDRDVIVPGESGGGRKQTAKVEAEMTERTFTPTKEQGILLLPVDDVLVGTVNRLSAGGSLSSGRPLTDVHPNYLQELFGQRLGSQAGANRVAANLPGKETVRVEGVFQVPSIANVNDHEFKALREGAGGLKSPLTPPKNQMLVVLRTVFSRDLADKDSHVRVGPGAVRLVADGPDGARVNYYPIGTMQGPERLYANRVDDFLFLGVQDGEKAADFVFQVDREGFLSAGSAAGAEQIADRTFLEVKRMARVDLSGKKIGTGWEPPTGTPVSVLRKELSREDGGLPPPLEQFTASGRVRPDQAARGVLVGTWKGKGNGKDITLKIDEAEMLLDIKTPVVNTTESFKGFWQPVKVDKNVITVDFNNLKGQGGKNIKEQVDLTLQGQDTFTFKLNDPTQVLGEGPVTLKRTASGERQ